MASSRKDTKGYVLRTDECQRSDGRYSYSYTDQESNRHVVYAKSLAELRKKERKIIRDLEDGIDAHAPEKTTVNQLYSAFLQEYEMQKCLGYVSEEIDGFTNFVFLTAGGSVLSAGSVNRAITNISEAYFLYKIL